MSLARFAFYLGQGLWQLDDSPWMPILGHGPRRLRWIALIELAEQERTGL